MRPSVPRGNKKTTVQPVTITTNTVCRKFGDCFRDKFLIGNRHLNRKYPNGQFKREKQIKKDN
jgi:hypothetical protein